jgi:hypothetical protein
MIKLSNSRINLYNECGFKFKLKYIDKLSTDTIYSALHFGGAIDVALNNLLFDSREGNLKSKKAYQDQFEEAWSTKDNDNVCDSENFDYYKKEFRVDLLTLEQMMEIAAVYQTAPENITYESNKKAYNLVCWYSNLNIGKAIVHTYYDQVLPSLLKDFEILSVQEELCVTNDDGDPFTAILDFTAKSRSSNAHFVMDNKTTSNIKKDYKEGCVEVSQQLGLYTEFKNCKDAGYIALEKKILPDGYVPWVIVTGQVYDVTKELIFNKVSDTLFKIKSGEFEKNEKSCFNFGRKCEFYNYCKFGKISGLHRKE